MKSVYIQLFSGICARLTQVDMFKVNKLSMFFPFLWWKIHLMKNEVVLSRFHQRTCSNLEFTLQNGHTHNNNEVDTITILQHLLSVESTCSKSSN